MAASGARRRAGRVYYNPVGAAAVDDGTFLGIRQIGPARIGRPARSRGGDYTGFGGGRGSIMAVSWRWISGSGGRVRWGSSFRSASGCLVGSRWEGQPYGRRGTQVLCAAEFGVRSARGFQVPRRDAPRVLASPVAPRDCSVESGGISPAGPVAILMLTGGGRGFPVGTIGSMAERNGWGRDGGRRYGRRYGSR